MENENKKTGNKAVFATFALYFPFMFYWILYRILSDKKIPCVGENAFKLKAALSIFLDIFAVFLIVLSVVVFVKFRKNTEMKKRRAAICAVIFLDMIFNLISWNSLPYIHDLKSGATEVTTDLYFVQSMKGYTRLAFSDGNEPEYYNITEELGDFIDENTSLCTDEDYIQKRLDEQNSVLRIKPSPESITVEYYPETKFIKSVLINE